MTGFFIMLKSNIKLVLRNKASILLLFLIPIASTLILKVPLNRDNSQLTNIKSNITVFDNSRGSLSKEIIALLKGNSSFNITVDTGKTKDLNYAREKAIDIANKSTDNGFVYIPENLTDLVMKGQSNELITIFTTGTDDRISLLKGDINMALLRFNNYSKIANGNKKVFEELLKKGESDKTLGKSISITTGEISLNSTEKSQINNFGLLIAIMSITLIFSGNFISAIFSLERSNGVLMRITLTKSSLFNYAVVKALLAFIVLIVQIVMVIFGIKLFVKVDVGINLWQIAILILGLGLILNTLSIALGAFFENLNSANYLAFFIITITALMSGLYFPIDIMPKWMQNTAILMPQRWVIRTAEQILLGSSGCIMLFGVIVISFMAFFLSIGFLGLKLNSK